MRVIDEATAESIINDANAFDAIENVFAAMARGDARNFPVVREAIGVADALYGFKSGIDTAAHKLGVKAGGYWPHNSERNLTNHQSSVLLFDPDTGRLIGVVSGNYLTAVRTAAACAVSVEHLARKDAKVLGIVGAGHQSAFQLRAVARTRQFEKIVAWNLTPKEVEARLGPVARELGLPLESVSRDQLCAEADVIVTITSCHEALLSAEQIRPGTHISCMGTDTVGKQEIDPAILAKSRVFADEIAQVIELGECQHAIKAGILAVDDITTLGDVVIGKAQGRTHADDITVFDGTGVGLQDLAVAGRVYDLVEAQDTATASA